MCADPPGFDYYDYCPYSCCDEREDDFCCKHAAPMLGAIVSVAVLISVVVITLCCCRRQKGAPGVVITEGNINYNTIIETGLKEDGRKLTNHCARRDLTQHLADKHLSVNTILQISGQNNVALVNEYTKENEKHQDFSRILDYTGALASTIGAVPLYQTSLNWNASNAPGCHISSVYSGDIYGLNVDKF